MRGEDFISTTVKTPISLAGSILSTVFLLLKRKCFGASMWVPKWVLSVILDLIEAVLDSVRSYLVSFGQVGRLFERVRVRS